MACHLRTQLLPWYVEAHWDPADAAETCRDPQPTVCPEPLRITSCRPRTSTLVNIPCEATLSDLDTVEQNVRRDLEAGRRVTFTKGDFVHSRDFASRPPEDWYGRTVRGEVLAEILWRIQAQSRDTTVRLEGLQVQGDLTLDGLKLPGGLELIGCYLSGATVIDHLLAPRVVLRGCWISGLSARWAQVAGGLDLTGSFSDAPIDLKGANLGEPHRPRDRGEGVPEGPSRARYRTATRYSRSGTAELRTSRP